MCEEANMMVGGYNHARGRYAAIQTGSSFKFHTNRFLAKWPHWFISHATITKWTGKWRSNEGAMDMDDGGVRHTRTHGILTGDGRARIYVKRQNRRG